MSEAEPSQNLTLSESCVEKIRHLPDILSGTYTIDGKTYIFNHSKRNTRVIFRLSGDSSTRRYAHDFTYDLSTGKASGEIGDNLESFLDAVLFHHDINLSRASISDLNINI